MGIIWKAIGWGAKCILSERFVRARQGKGQAGVRTEWSSGLTKEPTWVKQGVSDTAGTPGLDRG